MAKQILIYWRDIPAQVIVQQGRRREKVKLSARFEKAIDRAAMRAGKGNSELYANWSRSSVTNACCNSSAITVRPATSNV
jgi:hypothetical protein